MKKAFLVFGIAAFSSASAQQKDVFDMNRHIQEVLKNKTTPGIGVKEFITRFGQSQSRLSQILPNGDKIYILSGDNMPCVIPDLSQFNTPNLANPKEYYNSPLFKNDTPGAIPNAVKPYRLIVSK